MNTITGSCLCGEVVFTVKDDFIYAGYCHCSRCRKATGAAGAAIGAVAKDSVTVIQGESSLRFYQRSEQSISCFCQSCGSTLFGEKPQTGLRHIRYGVLDDCPSLLPQAHMHVASKADWYTITDALPQFAASVPH